MTRLRVQTLKPRLDVVACILSSIPYLTSMMNMEQNNSLGYTVGRDGRRMTSSYLKIHESGIPTVA
jgi:hypothetical protein